MSWPFEVPIQQRMWMPARRGNEVIHTCQQDPMSWGRISSHCMSLHQVSWKSIFAIAETDENKPKGVIKPGSCLEQLSLSCGPLLFYPGCLWDPPRACQFLYSNLRPGLALSFESPDQLPSNFFLVLRCWWPI